jgi:hypothetical protein
VALKRTEILILGLLLSACFASSAFAQTDGSTQANSRDLSYLSVPMGNVIYTTEASNSVDGFPADTAAAIRKPKKAFSPEQEKLMQDLSKLIVVNSMGFCLALNLKY